jgi:hypothetical protein
MPYFKNNDVNILFIHIPKTGGSSVEIYLRLKHRIQISYWELYGIFPDDLKTKHNIENNCDELEHYTYNDIYDVREIFNIDFNNLTIFTIVRNPYTRLISDLFFFDLINPNTDKNEIPEIIRLFIEENKDNHN